MFGTVIRDSPKYKVIDEPPSVSVKADGPIPGGAKLTANSEMLFGPERFIMDNAKGFRLNHLVNTDLRAAHQLDDPPAADALAGLSQPPLTPDGSGRGRRAVHEVGR